MRPNYRNICIAVLGFVATCLTLYQFTNRPTADDAERHFPLRNDVRGNVKKEEVRTTVSTTVATTVATVPTIGLAELERDATAAIGKVRTIKAQGTVMETDPVALEAIAKLQVAVRKLLAEKYGEEPYVVEMKVRYGGKKLQQSRVPAVQVKCNARCVHFFA